MIKTANANPRFKIAMTAVMLVTFSLLLVGCSGNAPLAPTDQILSGLEKVELVEQVRGDNLFEPAGDGWLGKRQTHLVQQIDVAFEFEPIGVDGGELELILGDEKTELNIPEGALDTWVQISALAVSFNIFENGELTFYDFGPDGLVFNIAATLTLETHLRKGTTLSLYWWNPAKSRWEVEESATVKKDGVIEFKVYHFSKYAIS